MGWINFWIGAQWQTIFHFHYWSRLQKTKFWSLILKSSWDFLILCSTFLLGKEHRIRIKKSQNDLKIALQNFVFLKFLASNENGRCEQDFYMFICTFVFFRFFDMNETEDAPKSRKFKVLLQIWFQSIAFSHLVDSYTYSLFASLSLAKSFFATSC